MPIIHIAFFNPSRVQHERNAEGKHNRNVQRQIVWILQNSLLDPLKSSFLLVVHQHGEETYHRNRARLDPQQLAEFAQRRDHHADQYGRNYRLGELVEDGVSGPASPNRKGDGQDHLHQQDK